MPFSIVNIWIVIVILYILYLEFSLFLCFICWDDLICFFVLKCISLYALYVEILSVEIYMNDYYCKSKMLQLMMWNCLVYVQKILKILWEYYWPQSIILDHMLALPSTNCSVFLYYCPVRIGEQGNREEKTSSVPMGSTVDLSVCFWFSPQCITANIHTHKSNHAIPTTDLSA